MIVVPNYGFSQEIDVKLCNQKMPSAFGLLTHIFFSPDFHDGFSHSANDNNKIKIPEREKINLCFCVETIKLFDWVFLFIEFSSMYS